MKTTLLLAILGLLSANFANAALIQNQTVIAGTLSNSAGYPLYTFVQDTSAAGNQAATARGHGLRGFYLASPIR